MSFTRSVVVDLLVDIFIFLDNRTFRN